MFDSDQEPSYNLSKNLLLLPRILKLRKDMVDDSTPLNIELSVDYCTKYWMCLTRNEVAIMKELQIANINKIHFHFTFATLYIYTVKN